MPSVIVTGANGFVGQHLIDELLTAGYEVQAIGGSQAPALADKPGLRSVTLDLSKAEATQQIDFKGVDGVVHLAGLAAVGPSFDDPMLYVNVNIGIQTNLFEAALAKKAKPRFLVISSATLYDPAAELPLTEVSPTIPTSPYAVSKLGQEKMTQYYGSRGFEYVIARPFNHIGPGQNTGFIVPDLAQQVVACQNGQTQAVSVGNLDAKRDYTDVRDIVRAYRLMLEKGVSGETYNICSGKPLSGHEILEGILEAASIKPEIKPDPALMRPSDNPVIFGSYDKLAKATGWQPEIPIDKTLADVLADWQARANTKA